MIKSNMGHLEIEGSDVRIKSELTTIFRGLMEDDIGMTREDIIQCIDIAEKDESQLLDATIENLTEILKEALSEIFAKEDEKK